MPNPYRQVWQEWPHNLKFRRAYRRPVKGGRWSVRKAPYRNIPKRWRAWCYGAAKRWNMSFRTHAQAVSWASFVADCYTRYDQQSADQMIKQRKTEMFLEERAERVERAAERVNA